MAGVSKDLIDQALNDEQLSLPADVNIGSIYVDTKAAECNWMARFHAVDDAGSDKAKEAIERVQLRYPKVSMADMFCSYF